MHKMLSDKKSIFLFILPGLLIYGLVYIFPIIYTSGLSMTDWGGLGKPHFIGFNNYEKLFTKDTTLWLSLRNNLLVMLLASAGQVIPAIIFAFLLNRFTKGLRAFKVIFFIPVILSTTAISLLWQKLYDPNYGAINSFLAAIGHENYAKAWLSDGKTAIFAIIIPVIWQYIGYHLAIIYAGLKGIPEQYIEAAKIDGANGVKAILHVTLPLLRDVIKVCIVLAVVGGLKIFDNIYIMTGGGPYNQTSTLAIKMYTESFLKMQYGYGSSIAVTLAVFCIIMFYAINKLISRDAVEY